MIDPREGSETIQGAMSPSLTGDQVEFGNITGTQKNPGHSRTRVERHRNRASLTLYISGGLGHGSDETHALIERIPIVVDTLMDASSFPICKPMATRRGSAAVPATMPIPLVCGGWLILTGLHPTLEHPGSQAVFAEF